jgi:hypothetical protein
MEYLLYGVINSSLDGLFKEADRKMLYRVDGIQFLVSNSEKVESLKPYVLKDKTIILRSNYAK